VKHVTLVFLRRDGEVLLAMKKVRFGAGKWNGPGGKVETGETYKQAAVRECQEEVGVTPRNLQKVGELHFFDLPDVEHYCHIYTATEWDSEPSESEEMRPQWFAESQIPYDAMWPDDKFWLPLLLAGKRFKGKVVVDNDRIRESEFHEVTML
jgi:8-oxo-dGTP diphosphatase